MYLTSSHKDTHPYLQHVEYVYFLFLEETRVVQISENNIATEMKFKSLSTNSTQILKISIGVSP